MRPSGLLLLEVLLLFVGYGESDPVHVAGGRIEVVYHSTKELKLCTRDNMYMIVEA